MLNTVTSAHRFPLFGYIRCVPASYYTLQCQNLHSHKPKLIGIRSLSRLCLTVTGPKGTLILVRCLSGNYRACAVFHLRVAVNVTLGDQNEHLQIARFVRFEIFKAMTLKITVLWEMTPCNLEDMLKRIAPTEIYNYLSFQLYMLDS